MQRVLVVGGSSGIGKRTVEFGARRGLEMVPFSRHAQSSTAATEVINGDALVAGDIEQALDGVDAVVQSLGVPMNLRLLTGPITLFSCATEILLPAMQNAGVRRLVVVTGFGAGDCEQAIHPLQRPGFNLVFGRAYADKGKQEALVRNSDLDWTIVRPGVLTNGPLKDNYAVLTEPHEWRNGVISRDCVADFIVRCLQDKSHVHQAPVLVG